MIVSNSGYSIFELLVNLVISSLLLIGFTKFAAVHLHSYQKQIKALNNSIELNRVANLILDLAFKANRIKGVNGIKSTEISNKYPIKEGIFFIICDFNLDSKPYYEITKSNNTSLVENKGVAESYSFSVTDYISISNDENGILRWRDLITGENQPISNRVNLVVKGEEQIELSIDKQKISIPFNFKKTNFLTLLEWN